MAECISTYIYHLAWPDERGQEEEDNQMEERRKIQFAMRYNSGAKAAFAYGRNDFIYFFSFQGFMVSFRHEHRIFQIILVIEL